MTFFELLYIFLHFFRIFLRLPLATQSAQVLLLLPLNLKFSSSLQNWVVEVLDVTVDEVLDIEVGAEVLGDGAFVGAGAGALVGVLTGLLSSPEASVHSPFIQRRQPELSSSPACNQVFQKPYPSLLRWSLSF